MENKNRVIKLVAKRLLLGLGVLTVLILFTLPLTFYYIYEYTNIKGHNSDDQPQIVTVPNNSMNCSLKWSEHLYLSSINYTDDDSTEQQCISSEYATGGVCEEVLLEWARCAIGNYSHIPITEPYQATLNDDINEVFELLNSFPDCHSQAVPFICQYYYPLVDCENDVMFTASKEQCTNIVNTVCSVPWSLAVLAGIADDLPNCDSLQESSLISNSSNITTTNSSIICKDDFFEVDGLCVPHCEQVHLGPEFYSRFEDACQIIYTISIVVLIIFAMTYSIKEWKKTFRFPTLFAVFMICNLGVAGITDSVSFFSGPKLFCKENNLVESILTEATAFCLINGILLNYTIMSACIWWFIHLSILLFRVAFPFKARQLNDSNKCKFLYCLLTVGGFLFPIPGIVVALTTDGNRFGVASIPPRICSPPATWRFYFLVLPISVIFAIGVLFLCYIIITINKLRSSSLGNQVLVSGDRKLLIFLVMFLVFGEYTVILSMITILNEDSLNNAISTYFQCEATGHVPGKCDTTVVEKWGTIIFILEGVLSLLSTGLLMGILGLFVDWRKLYKAIHKQKNRLSRYSTSGIQ